MSATPTTITQLNDLAKDYFSEVYVPLMNVDTPFKNQLEKLEDAVFTGRKWIFATKLSVGGGASNAGANKTLPAASQGVYDQGDCPVVRTYTRMALDGLLMEITKMKAGSYRPAVAETMSDRLQAHDLEINRQCFCNGDGKGGLIAAAVASATQTLKNDYGVANGGSGSRHFYIGDQVAFYQNNGTLIARKTILSVDPVAQTITVDSSVTTTSTTDWVSKSTVDDDNTSAGEAIGVLATCDNTGRATLNNIASNPLWTVYKDTNGGTLRDITDPMVMVALEATRQRSKTVPNLAITSPGIQLKYSEIFLPIRRIDGQDVALRGGYKPITFIQHGGGQIPVMTDNDAPKSRLCLLNTAAFRWADLVGSEWFDMDGAVFTRIIDKDGAEGFIRKYWALICVQRNAIAMLEDLNDYTAIDRRF